MNFGPSITNIKNEAEAPNLVFADVINQRILESTFPYYGFLLAIINHRQTDDNRTEKNHTKTDLISGTRNSIQMKNLVFTSSLSFIKLGMWRCLILIIRCN